MTLKKLSAAILTVFLAVSTAAAPAMASHHHHHLLRDAAIGSVAGLTIGAIAH